LLVIIDKKKFNIKLSIEKLTVDLPTD